LIEAMACGTPVIAYPGGSIPEIIRDGVNGRIVTSEAEGIAAVRAIDEIDRALCRRDFEERFTARRMARDYLRVYHGLVAAAGATPPVGVRPSA
jgi:glycosyltransferase involved in cell wall biosynthesis